MARLSINELKARFATADLPTQKDYADLIDTLLANLTSATINPGGAYFYAPAVLSGNTYVASYTPSVTAYMDGTVLAFKADLANPVGVVQFDAGNGAADVKKLNTLDLDVGDIQAGQIVEVRFNGTFGTWQLLSGCFRPGHRACDIRFSGITLPEDGTRLLCDGRTVSLTIYPSLTPIVGIFGSASVGNVVIPDMRRRVPVGAGSGIPTLSPGNTGGEEKHLLLGAEMPSHQHAGPTQYVTPVQRGSADTSVFVPTNHNDGTHTLIGTGFTGGGQTHNNMQPYTVFNYYIML